MKIISEPWKSKPGQHDTELDFGRLRMSSWSISRFSAYPLDSCFGFLSAILPVRAARPVTFRTPGTNTPNRSHTNIMSAVTMTSIVAPTAKVSAAPRVGPASRSDDQLQGTFVSRSLPCDFATPRSRRPACARLRDPRPSLTLNHPRSDPNSRSPASRATSSAPRPPPSARATAPRP